MSLLILKIVLIKIKNLDYIKMSLNQLANFNDNAQNNLHIACDDLKITCNNGDLLSLRPQSKGLLNQVLASSGEGTIDFITIGGSSLGNMLFTGSSQVGRHYRASDNSGVNVVQSVLTETKDDFDFANKSLSNISEIITPNLGIQTSGNINIETSDLNIESSANTNIINSGNLQFQTFGNYTVQTPNNMILTTPQIETNEILLGSIVNNNNLLSSQFIQMKNEDGNFNTVTPSKVEVKDVAEKSTLNSSGLSFQSILNPANQTIYGAVSIFKDSNSQTIDNIINKTQNLVDGTLQDINSITNTTGTLSITSPFTVSIDTALTHFNNSVLYTNANSTANSFIKIGGLSNQVLMADGSTQPYNAGSGNSNYYIYENDTSTTVPPSQAGRINFNNSVQQNATTVWINHLTNDSNGGTDIDPFFELILAGSDILYIQDRSNSTNYIKFNILTKVIIPNNYMTLGVAFLSGEGTGLTSFGNNHPIFFSIFNNIPQIDARLDALENKTQYQSTPIANQTNFTGAVYADEFKKSGGTSTQYLMADGSTISGLYNLSSVGTGQTLVNSGSGTDFKTKSLIAGSNISLSSTSDEVTITGTTPPSTLASAGVGTSLINSSIFPNFVLKSLTVQSGMFLNDIGGTIYLGVSNPSTNISLTSVGTGSSLIPTTSSNPNFQVKSIIQGGGMSIINNANDITITNNSPSTLISLNSSGSGENLINTTLSSNPDFYLKSLASGTGISLSNTANTVTVTNSSPASDITLASNGFGQSLISSQNNPDFRLKGLLSGSNISITQSGLIDLTISATGLLPLAGGTMTGNIDMGSQQITNSTGISTSALTLTGATSSGQPYFNATSLATATKDFFIQSGVQTIQNTINNATVGSVINLSSSQWTESVVCSGQNYTIAGAPCANFNQMTQITGNFSIGAVSPATTQTRIRLKDLKIQGNLTFNGNATYQELRTYIDNCDISGTITFTTTVNTASGGGQIYFYNCSFSGSNNPVFTIANSASVTYYFTNCSFNGQPFTNNLAVGNFNKLILTNCSIMSTLSLGNCVLNGLNASTTVSSLTATSLTLGGTTSQFLLGNGTTTSNTAYTQITSQASNWVYNTVNIPFQARRVGVANNAMVTIFIGGFSATAATTTSTLISSSVLGATFRPINAVFFPCRIQKNSVVQLGCCIIYASGEVGFTDIAQTTNFWASGTAGCGLAGDFSVSFPTNA